MYIYIYIYIYIFKLLKGDQSLVVSLNDTAMSSDNSLDRIITRLLSP